MEILNNYINGTWSVSNERDFQDIINPANQAVLAKVPVGNATAKDVDGAVNAASAALQSWSNTPVMERDKYIITKINSNEIQTNSIAYYNISINHYWTKQ